MAWSDWKTTVRSSSRPHLILRKYSSARTMLGTISRPAPRSAACITARAFVPSRGLAVRYQERACVSTRWSAIGDVLEFTQPLFPNLFQRRVDVQVRRHLVFPFAIEGFPGR